MPHFTLKPRFVAAAQALAIAAVFTLDLLTPPGIGDGIGYAAAMTLCLWLPGERAVLIAALVSTALTVAAEFLTPQGAVGNGEWIDRAFIIVTIWVAAALLHRRKSAAQSPAAARIGRDAHAAAATSPARADHHLRNALSPVGGLLVALAGVAVLVGWALNIPSLTSVLPGLVAMRPITAAAFVFSGAALFFLHLHGRRARWAARCGASLAGLLGVLTLLDHLTPYELGLDRWLYERLTAFHGAAAPQWSMSYYAGSSFALFAVAVLTLDAKGAWLRRISIAAGTLGLLIGALALLGYVYDVNSLYRFMGTQPTALHTATSFVILFTSVALATPDRGWVAILLGDSVGKAMMRQLLLATVAIPLVVGFLVTHLGHYQSIGPQFGIAILALSTVTVLAAAIWWSTTLLDLLDADRRGKEAALQASQAMLATAENVARVGSWEWDILRNKLIWSDEHCRLFGYEPEPASATNDHWLARVHPADKARVRHAADVAVSGAKPYDIDYRVVLPDGTERTINSKGEVFRDAAGKAIRMVGTVHDITERQRAENALQHQLTLLATIMDNATEAIFLLDGNGRLTFMNHAAERLFGWTQAELLGKVLHDEIHHRHPDGRPYPASECPFFRVLTTLEAQTSREDKWIRKDGSFVDVSCSNAPIVEGGKAVGAVLVMHDITARKRAEEALHQSEVQLRQAQKMEAVGQLTGGVAHDFNNLLSVVMGNLDLILERTGRDPVLRKLAQAALDGCLRGAELTKRLLAFARRQTLQPRGTNLSERLSQMSALLQRALGERILVRIIVATDLWPVLVDASQIDDSILNLALNARDAMPSGGTLTIEAMNSVLDADYAARTVDVVPGDYVLLTITDTGCGMPADVLERVFEPFFTTKEAGKGSGLGLSMVYGFVKQSRGHIRIYSEVGIGTTVNIYLPRAKTAESAAAESGPEAVGLPGHGELVLVVEDNEDVRRTVIWQLTELGYKTLAAESGEKALALFAEHPEIDLVFSDVVMRGSMDGYALARRLRKQRPDARILLTSGFTMKSIAEGQEDAGEFDLLKKPYRKNELAQKLKQLLAAQRTAA